MISFTAKHAAETLAALGTNIGAFAFIMALYRRSLRGSLAAHAAMLALALVSVVFLIRLYIRVVQMESATLLTISRVSTLDAGAVLALVVIQAAWAYAIFRVSKGFDSFPRRCVTVAVPALAGLSTVCICFQYLRMLNIQGKLSL